jgi:transposase
MNVSALFINGLTELACLVHIRCKFFDVHAASGSSVAEEILCRIAALYAIEQQGARGNPPQRLALRQRMTASAGAGRPARLVVGDSTRSRQRHGLTNYHQPITPA